MGSLQHNSRQYYAGLILLSMLMSSCASTTLTTTWHDPNYSGNHSLQDILIIAVTKEETARRLYEDGFVSKLSEEGIRGTQSYTLQTSDIKLTKPAVEAAIAAANARFVLITRHLSTDTKQHYRPPEPVSVFADPYYSRVHRYYPMAYREVSYRPGYTYDVTTVSMELNLYDAKTEKLIWTAQSQSVDPKMTKDYIDELITKKWSPALGPGCKL